MKKVIFCALSIAGAALLFLLLPPLLPADAANWTLWLCLTLSALWGVLLPFACRGDRSVAVIEGAAFIAFAWAGGWLCPALSLPGAGIAAGMMIAAALCTVAVKRSLPIRFVPKRLPLKLFFAALELAALVGVFFCWASYRPEGLTSMEMDGYACTLILLWFPLFSVVYGLLLPLLCCGDSGFMALSAAAYVLLGFGGLMYSGILAPVGILLFVPLMLLAAAGSNWLLHGRLGRGKALAGARI